MGQVGEGLSTIGELLPPVDFDGSPLTLLPPGVVIDEEEYEQKQQRLEESTQQRVTSSQTPKSPKCTTPSGGLGRCTDIQNCPILLADLQTLRKSVIILMLKKSLIQCLSFRYASSRFLCLEFVVQLQGKLCISP